MVIDVLIFTQTQAHSVTRVDSGSREQVFASMSSVVQSLGPTKMLSTILYDLDLDAQMCHGTALSEKL